MPRSILVAIFGVVMMSIPAATLAADLGQSDKSSLKDPEPYAAPYAWSGVYFGIHGGYGWGHSSIRDGGTNIENPSINPPYGAFSCGPALTGNYCGTPFELESEGWLGGVQLGANWQRGVIVLGIEGDLGYLGIKEDHVLLRPFEDRDFASVEFGWYGTATGRLGYALDRSLLYVKGGLAVARIETEAADIDGSAIYEGSHIRSTQTEIGWALGGGIEHALGDRLSVKAEYLYMDFGSETSRSPDGDIYEHENQLHTAKIGLNYHLTSESEPLK